MVMGFGIGLGAHAFNEHLETDQGRGVCTGVSTGSRSQLGHTVRLCALHGRGSKF